MSISSLNSATNNPYAMTVPKKVATTGEQSTAMAMDVNKNLATKALPTQQATEAAPTDSELSTEDSVKSFAYGFLGFDKPSEIEKDVVEEVEVKTEAEEQEEEAHFAGRVAKGIGTLGTIIAILV